MNKPEISKLQPESCGIIADWCRDRNEDFLSQWAGAGYRYPLTADQMLHRLDGGAEIFEVCLDGQLTATIEVIERSQQDGSALIGRFLMNPALTGRGLGTEVMRSFLRYCKESLDFSAATLFVFDFNTGAHRCYQKCGFEETGRVQRPNGWTAISMKKIL